MAVIQDEQGNNKPIKTDTSHVFDVNGNPLHGELFIGETIASEDVEAIDGFAHESDIDAINQNLAELQNNRVGAYISLNSYTTFANAYTAPSDGYIMAISGGTLGDVIMLDVENRVHLSSRCETTNYSVYTTLFVRKGMRIHVSANKGNRGESYFYPIE